MRALITGASGFAGRWLAQLCVAEGDEVLGIARSAAAGPEAGHVAVCDLTDGRQLDQVVAGFAPHVVYHLAALSHVGRSWEEPARTLSENVTGAINLLEAVRRHAPQARVVWASSCEVYGTAAALPVTEDAPFSPESPYAVSKATGEMLANLYRDAHGLRVVCARPFNHTGPGQRPIFLSSSLAEQAARARVAGAGELTLVTGSPDTRRDFTDVRDVARAYRLLATADVPPGPFNISTGRSVSAGEQVAIVAELIAPIAVRHEVDPTRVRAHEVMDQRGSADALRETTGWKPEIPLRRTLADTIAWWEAVLAPAE